MIRIKALPMKKREKNAAFLTPNILTNVFVPTFLSASASRISFVVVPPTRNKAAIDPIARGRCWKGSAKALQEPRIARKPRGSATQSWLTNKYFFMRGEREYVIEKAAIRNTNILNKRLIVSEKTSAIIYITNDRVYASRTEAMPWGIGR